MFDENVPKISSSVARAIEEAILLGSSKEIGDVLTLIRDDDDFPETVRYGLEAMFYFRRYYGAGGELEPMKTEDKKKILEMEALWGRELIESLDTYAAPSSAQYAQE
jgi:hypothetical protein